jgi:hypothetical protein
MFTEQEFREAFRAQVDDEVADVVGVSAPATAPVVPLRRRPRWPVLVGAAAGVLVLAGAAIAGAQLWDPDPAPPADPEPAEAVTVQGAIVTDDDVADVTLQSVDGCLAIDPDTLLVVNEPVWAWNSAAGALTWLPSSQSEPYRLGDSFRMGGQRVAVDELDDAVLPPSCADFAGSLWLAGTPRSQGGEDSLPIDLLTPADVAVATGEKDSETQPLVRDTLQARDGCLMFGDRLLVVGPSWFWDTPRAVLIDRWSGTEFRIGDQMALSGNAVEVSKGEASMGGPLSLPASCAAYEGPAWSAGARGRGHAEQGGPSATQRTTVAEAIGAVRDRYPEADGGGAYDLATSTYTMWIVEGAPGAEAYRAELFDALTADASGSTTIVTKPSSTPSAQADVIVEEILEASRNDPDWPEGIAMTGEYSPSEEAFVLSVGERWRDEDVVEYFRERFDDRVVLSSMEPVVPQSLGS